MRLVGGANSRCLGQNNKQGRSVMITRTGAREGRFCLGGGGPDVQLIRIRLTDVTCHTVGKHRWASRIEGVLSTTTYPCSK